MGLLRKPFFFFSWNENHKFGNNIFSFLDVLLYSILKIGKHDFGSQENKSAGGTSLVITDLTVVYVRVFFHYPFPGLPCCKPVLHTCCFSLLQPQMIISSLPVDFFPLTGLSKSNQKAKSYKISMSCPSASPLSYICPPWVQISSSFFPSSRCPICTSS